MLPTSEAPAIGNRKMIAIAITAQTFIGGILGAVIGICSIVGFYYFVAPQILMLLLHFASDTVLL